MTEINTHTTLPFWAEAEMAYRLERAQNAWGGSGRSRRHRVRRRPSLKLPFPRRRPIAVA